MRRYLPFIVALIGLLLAIQKADAACAGGTCFWIGGAGTLNLATDTAHWSVSSGGATCACDPATTDDIVFDGASGGGTVTVTIGGGTWTANSITMGAFTGTLDFSTSNNNVTLATLFSNNGSGTRTLNLGNGTWSLTSGTALWFSNSTNLTFNANASTISFSGTATNFRRFLGGGLTYSTVTVNAGAGNLFVISGNNTFATLTIGAANQVSLTNSTTQTVTTLTNIAASSSTAVLFSNNDGTSTSPIISSANNWSCTWCGFSSVAFSGGGTFSATSSLDFGKNTGITITPPSAAGGGSHIIGSGL